MDVTLSAFHEISFCSFIVLAVDQHYLTESAVQIGLVCQRKYKESF
jgi:hypothetical protein